MKQGWLQKANINSSLSVSMRVSQDCRVIPAKLAQCGGKNWAEKMLSDKGHRFLRPHATLTQQTLIRGGFIRHAKSPFIP